MMVLFQLLSSLPMLKLFEKPAIRHEDFMADCASWIHGRDLETLRNFTLEPGGNAHDGGTRRETSSARKAPDAPATPDPRDLEAFPENSLARAYSEFETALRHSLMKLRLAQLGSGFEGPRAGLTLFDVEAGKIAQAAMLVKNPLEREKMLDRARWTKLEELEQKTRRPFHFDAVCAYSMKLQIAEKWIDRIPGAQAEANLTDAAAKVGASLDSRS